MLKKGRTKYIHSLVAVVLHVTVEWIHHPTSYCNVLGCLVIILGTDPCVRNRKDASVVLKSVQPLAAVNPSSGP